MGSAPLPQAIPSSYQWGGLFDFIRRKGANSGSFDGADQLKIVRAVSSIAYSKYMWPFTMATTSLGQIQCINGQQDYPQPSNLYRLSRAWFYVPNDYTVSNDYGPYDDPSPQAADALALSEAYIASQANGGGSPAGITWPPDGSLNVVKRLPLNLIYGSYTSIRAICQQPNQNVLRLEAATAVSASRPFSLELEFQLARPAISSLTEACWFPDDYVRMAEEGILYYLYKYTNDSRAGSVSWVNGTPAYSGQLASWMESMASAAAQDREGSVDTISPSESLGASYGTTGWWF